MQESSHIFTHDEIVVLTRNVNSEGAHGNAHVKRKDNNWDAIVAKNVRRKSNGVYFTMLYNYVNP